ncbi:PLP-dependent transferase [Microstroma glucosiphilum]|uniref:PLP-dependent transferase n=1 Tax=Pseudomicrostroma glucosiphilum TaxID=1684307 RepID=A0A316TX97_9BASI|nr:PLP-dependent transferase [Pseudomicrostroma glucosiphilum]PWN17917.1 PLP-dependent transferase [Pseudomicrostroma glucosiphilum]
MAPTSAAAGSSASASSSATTTTTNNNNNNGTSAPSPPNGNPSNHSRIGTITQRITAEATRGPDVWSTFNPLVFPECVNLGQGFMNWSPPSFVRGALEQASKERVDVHHYSHPKGRPALRQALAKQVGESYRKPTNDESQDDFDVSSGAVPQQRADKGVGLDVETEIQVTAGANGAIYCAMTAFLEPGDEVIFLSPHFDQYECEVTFMGGKPIYVPLLPPKETKGSRARDWKVDWDALEKAFQRPKCKAIIFNTPHNPLGKVFSLEELQRLAVLCIKYDQLVLADEVYDVLTFDDQKHIRIASLQGMWNRTITVGSGGKTFAATGWRIGWAVGPAHLIKPVLVVHTRITFCTNSLAAEACAVGLNQAGKEGFYALQVREYEARRKVLCDALDALGLPYTLPEGAYFIMVDASALQVPKDYPFPSDLQPHYRLGYFVAKEAQVVSIPATAFVSKEHVPIFEKWLRLSFCKDVGVGGEGEVEKGGQLEQGGQRLLTLKKFLQ